MVFTEAEEEASKNFSLEGHNNELGNEPNIAPNEEDSKGQLEQGQENEAVVVGDEDRSGDTTILEETRSEKITGDEQEQEQKQEQQKRQEKFAYNAHGESVFDDVNVFPSLGSESNEARFDETNPEVIKHATLRALIVQLTSPEIIDYDLICDFFLSYRSFVSSKRVMQYLLVRLIWSLQYITSGQKSKATIGKLALLRTFVVLRHWILNYFYDDFVNDEELCNMFSDIVNQICLESSFLKNVTIFEQKIMKDLKCHWLSSINEFCKPEIDFKDSSQAEILMLKLPSYKELSYSPSNSRCETDMSIHTNPSFRRSAMLSLYDPKFQKGQFSNKLAKDKLNTDNSKFLVTNLFLQHQSSRSSINGKVEVLKKKSNAQNVKSRAILHSTNRHNCIDLKDTSLGLKKTSKVRGSIAKESNISKNQRSLAIGFSTNGNVKLPTSRVESILPPTPVKKMECIIKDLEFGDSIESPSKIIGYNDDEMKRKRSLKKLMENWKKSFINSSNLKETTDLQNIDDESKMLELIDNTVNDIYQTKNSRDKSIDVLSARIIEELEYLIRYYTSAAVDIPTEYRKDLYSARKFASMDQFSKFESCLEMDVDVFYEESTNGSPRKDRTSLISRSLPSTLQSNTRRTSLLSNTRSLSKVFSSRSSHAGEVLKGTYAESRPVSQSSNARMSCASKASFQRPTSINWNDEGLELENSADKENEFSGFNLSSSFQLKEISDPQITVLSYPEPQFSNLQIDNKSLDSAISTPSNLTQYDAEIADLGIAISPQKKDVRRISLESRMRSQKRVSAISRNSYTSSFRKDSHSSGKSYLTYDSEFSSNLMTRELCEENANGNLKKKKGFNDLRKAAQTGHPSRASSNHYKSGSNFSGVSRNSSSRRSVRLSTLFALAELPFNELETTHEESENNIFRDSASERKSAHPIEEEDRESFVPAQNQTNNSSCSSDVGPEIDSHVLHELAAIPDESRDITDPVQYALTKLEGSKNSKYKRAMMEKTNMARKSSTYFDTTEDILRDINNANTCDVSEITQLDTSGSHLEPLRVAQSQSESQDDKDPSTSTPNVSRIEKDQEIDHEHICSPKSLLLAFSETTEPLLVESVIQEDIHVSFLLGYRSEILAEHFTIIERDILQAIDWKELIELQWNKELNPVVSWLEVIVNEEYFKESKGVNVVIARFNLMVNWIISEVLLTKHQHDRINLISRLVHVAQNCYVLQNYSTLMQIILALTSEKISSLKETWKNLHPGDILILKNLEELASPWKNFVNLRMSLNRIVSSKGCIPFVGLYLSDLIFNAERPAFIKMDNIQTAKITNDFDLSAGGDSTIATANEYDKMINFARFRTSVQIVKSLAQCIEWAANYNLDIDTDLLSKCLYIKSLDEEEMNNCVQFLSDA